MTCPTITSPECQRYAKYYHLFTRFLRFLICLAQVQPENAREIGDEDRNRGIISPTVASLPSHA